MKVKEYSEEYTIYLLFDKKNYNIISKIYGLYELSSLVDELEVVKRINTENNKSKWIRVNSIEDFIQIGKSHNGVYTSMYYAVRNNIFTYLILTFTYDDMLIIGFYLPADAKNEHNLKSITEKLCKEYKPAMLSVFLEEPPPDSKDDFIKKSKEMSLYQYLSKR